MCSTLFCPSLVWWSGVPLLYTQRHMLFIHLNVHCTIYRTRICKAFAQWYFRSPRSISLCCWGNVCTIVKVKRPQLTCIGDSDGINTATSSRPAVSVQLDGDIEECGGKNLGLQAVPTYRPGVGYCICTCIPRF